MADLITLIGFAWKPSIKTQPVIIIDLKRVSAMDSRGSITYLDPIVHRSHAKAAPTNRPQAQLKLQLR